MATENLVINSTFQQVEKSAEDIIKLQDEMAHIVTKINIDPTTSGLRVINDKLNVYGMKVEEDLAQAAINKTPADYKIGNVLEVKAIGTIGLTSAQGFNEPYCLVQTYTWTTDNAGVKTLNAQQIAFNSGLLMYGRKSVNTTTWDNWTPVSAKAKAQFIETLVQPADQAAGDYWALPLQSTVIDSPVNTRFNDHMKNHNNPHEVTAAQIGAVDTTLGNLTDEVFMGKIVRNRVYLDLKVTLPAINWSTVAPFTQTVQCDGIHVEDDGCPYGLIQSTDIPTAKKELEAFGYISLAETQNGFIKFTCYEDRPSVNMTIKVVR